MDDLIGFVRGRLDEDEAVARDAAAPWGDEANEYEWADLPDEITRHAARHDPARVLRQAAAMRTIVDLHAPVVLRDGGGAAYYDTTVVCRSCEPPRQFPERAYPCETLRHLAATWADHPDYRDEWRP